MTARSEIAGLEALFAQALSHHRDSRLAEARLLYRLILVQDPQQVVVWNHLGLASLSAGPRTAAQAIVRALRLAPALADGHSNLSAVQRAAGAFGAAAESLRRAIVSQPSLAAPYNNLGTIERESGRLAWAAGLFRRAALLAPEHPDIHCNLGVTLLQLGEYAEGWREHEWRLHPGAMIAASPRETGNPLWRGEGLAGKTLLLQAEQGLGDTLQFVRFAAPLAARGARVLVDAPPALTRLLETVPGVAGVVAAGDALPDHDFRLPLMSVPHRLGVTLETVPVQTPYLRAPPAGIEAWRRRLSAYPGLKVGLAWAGNPHLKLPWSGNANARRSIAFERLAPLFEIPGVTLISLQKDGAAGGPPVIDFMGEVEDFADTAALIEALDLVISVDTAVAHLAGALDKPVWILSRFDGCWRWLGHREDSPWYRSARLFHQPRRDDWGRVVEQVSTTLFELVKKTR